MKRVFFIILVLSIYGCCGEEKARNAEKLLYSSSAKDRNKGAMDLAGCGSKAKSAVPKLIQLLYDPNVGVQSGAAFALRRIDTPEARSALDKATSRK